MKSILILLLVGAITACSHPLEIIGEGDVRSSSGENDCLLQDQPCANYVAGNYQVSYLAAPREGWTFAGWEGCGSQFPLCTFDIPGTIVNQYLGQTAPPLRAVFVHAPSAPEIALSTSWSPVAGTLTVDVSFTNITPTSVQLFPKGLQGAWVEEAVSAPFSFELDLEQLPPGDYEMLVLAHDGSVAVSRSEVISVSGCNGHHELCNRGYNEVRYLTAHNAMSNADSGWVGPNQNWNVPTQLAAGVRGLMLDTYRAGYINLLGQVQVPGVDPDSAWLCHSVCALGKQPLADGLEEIRAFLDENPGAVVTLIVESYLSHTLTAAAFDEANLTPYAYVHTGGAWPTLGQMIEYDTRLVVLQDVALNPVYPWLMNVWAHSFETHFSASVPEDFSCADNRGSPGNDLFILNHFLTGVFGAPALAEQVNYNPLLLDRVKECELFYGRPANFVTVDFVDIGDAGLVVDGLNGVGQD